MTKTTSRSMWRVTSASMVGTALEFYDFALYGTMAALVFGTVFFPTGSPVVSLMAAFATFGAGFAARPLGAIIFGALGDRFGRKPILSATLLTMGGATFLIGLLPTYDTIGVFAPILLATLRILQGLGMGGEIGGAQLLTAEHAPSHRRGFYVGLLQAATLVGALLANGALLAVSGGFEESAFLAWAWRIPFLFSIVVVIVGLFIRLRVEESPVFEHLKTQEAVVKAPTATLIRRYPGRLVLCILLFLSSVPWYINATYVLSYGRDIAGFSNTTMLTITTIVSLLMLPAAPLGGRLSDRFGRKKVLGISAVGVIVILTFYFPLVSISPVFAFIGMLLLGFTAFIFGGVQGVMLSEQFGPSVRYSGVSIATAIGSVLGGGLAPFIATAIFAATGNTLWVAIYAIGAEALALLGILLLRERRGVDLLLEDPDYIGSTTKQDATNVPVTAVDSI
ncbi:MHS family MFS transporter [Cnuibacter physcomitrellae]|uniref:MFS transporter n=1 Tax=Cnuibacter physcomitrellae TaxID=1619308 RepID=UPI002175A877|nr:MFS transporter [Cnuibacter physcomitrellae]MCS5498226.1 MHS family MFS transporter [Cnuibacter physcomitrellae]